MDRRTAFNNAVSKVKAMSNAGLLAIWEALKNPWVWEDNFYNEHITLDEWADLVYSELTIHRGLTC